MDTLRWILLLVGAVIIAAVYFSGRRARRDVVAEISDADPVVPLERQEPRSDSRARGGDTQNVDQELARLGNLIAENRQHDGAGSARLKPTVASGARANAKTGHIATATGAPSPAQAVPSSPRVEEKIITLYVMAPPGGRFAGRAVWRAVEAAGLRHGQMQIFHRLADPERAAAEAIFSLANMVEPGIFDPARMDDFSTPGLTLFMQLPGPVNGITAVDSMVAAARQIAIELQGELRDQSRSVLSKQTIEHLHTDIMEYQRRLRLAQAGQ